MMYTLAILQVAYTFDAGPNACLYLLEPNVEEFLSVIDYVFPPNTENTAEYFKGLPVSVKPISEVYASIFIVFNNE